MGLVDYSSDDGDGEQDTSPRRTAPAPATTSLPPLPRAFHDLYAATVRAAPADDPSLHQGRRRAIPHVAGQWPSHLYIEWFPSPDEHARLNALLASLQRALAHAETYDGVHVGGGNSDIAAATPFHSLLTSDLSVPLPLHISLSRPLVLSTAAKADFLAGVVDAVGAATAAFDVAFAGLTWYRGPDSARAFLVLRAVAVSTDGDSDDGPLVALLDCCNEQVTAAGQPALYEAWRARSEPPSTASPFHISLAWTLASGTDSWATGTQEAYEKWQAEDRDDEGSARVPLRIRVESIKAKIGNVVADIPLRRPTTAGRVRHHQAARRQSNSNPSPSSLGQDARQRARVGTRHDTRDDTKARKRNLFGL